MDTSSPSEIAERRAGRQPERIVYIDGLRGLAVLLVLLCHAWHFSGRIDLSPGWRVALGQLYLGYWGVNLFFVISGFCLAWSLTAESNGASYRHLRAGSFFLRRARRLLPAYYVSLAALLVAGLALPPLYRLLGLPGPTLTVPDRDALLAHLLLAQSFYAAPPNSPLAPYWTLSLEAQWYVAMPALILVARRIGPVRLLVAVVALAIAYRAATWALLPQQFARIVIHALPGHLPEFALGVWAAWLVARGKALLPARAWCAISALLLVAGWVIFGLWGRDAPPTDAVIGGGFCALLLAGATPGVARRLLEWRPLSGLGTISYSVYLVHGIVMVEACALLGLLGLNGWWAVCAYLVGLPLLAITIGYSFYRTVERPPRRALKGRLPADHPARPGLRLPRLPADRPVVAALQPHAGPPPETPMADK